MIMKMIQDLGKRMEKIQEMFTKVLELKNKQTDEKIHQISKEEANQNEKK